MSEATNHYVEPGWFTRNVFNRSIAFLTRHGVSVWGSRELRVRGRKSGEWRTVPVNLLTIDGTAVPGRPPGRDPVGAQHPGRRRRRAAGRAHGSRPSPSPSSSGDAKVEMLRAYLRKWKMEVGVFFDGISADSTDEEIAAIAPKPPGRSVDRPDQPDRGRLRSRRGWGAGRRTRGRASRPWPRTTPSCRPAGTCRSARWRCS